MPLQKSFIKRSAHLEKLPTLHCHEDLIEEKRFVTRKELVHMMEQKKNKVYNMERFSSNDDF
jgi:hypothetical protein